MSNAALSDHNLSKNQFFSQPHSLSFQASGIAEIDVESEEELNRHSGEHSPEEGQSCTLCSWISDELPQLAESLKVQTKRADHLNDEQSKLMSELKRQVLENKELNSTNVALKGTVENQEKSLTTCTESLSETQAELDHLVEISAENSEKLTTVSQLLDDHVQGIQKGLHSFGEIDFLWTNHQTGEQDSSMFTPQLVENALVELGDQYQCLVDHQGVLFNYIALHGHRSLVLSDIVKAVFFIWRNQVRLTKKKGLLLQVSVCQSRRRNILASSLHYWRARAHVAAFTARVTDWICATGERANSRTRKTFFHWRR
eukprot:464326_1